MSLAKFLLCNHEPKSSILFPRLQAQCTYTTLVKGTQNMKYRMPPGEVAVLDPEASKRNMRMGPSTSTGCSLGPNVFLQRCSGSKFYGI